MNLGRAWEIKYGESTRDGKILIDSLEKAWQKSRKLGDMIEIAKKNVE